MTSTPRPVQSIKAGLGGERAAVDHEKSPSMGHTTDARYGAWCPAREDILQTK